MENLALGKIFCENPILMLETVSVAAQTGEKISDDVFSEICLNASNIKYASKAAIRVELQKIIMSQNSSQGLRTLFESGILKFILPQLDRCFYEPQRNKFHIYNVGEHIIRAVEAAPPIVQVKWAALFHDIGKPACSSCDASGIIHFYGHHIESVKIANDICHKFSFDADLTKEICTLVEYHDVHFEHSVKGVKRALSRLGENSFGMLLELQQADALAKSPQYFEDKKKGIEDLRQIYKYIISSGEPYRYSDLAIGKRDLIKMKYRAERQMREAMRILFDEVIENPELNNRDYLLKRAKIIQNKR